MVEIKNLRGEVIYTYDGDTLVGANLRILNLDGANLEGVDLHGANLSMVSLRYANLNYANLSECDLRWANLIGANLSLASLREANLNDANLSMANLKCACLTGANLIEAKLREANLKGACLIEANLTGADISWSDLGMAKLNEAKLDNIKYDDTTSFFLLQCPEKGSFIAYKKVNDRYIVELEIPEDAKRSSATSRKCRCSKAKVLGIYNLVHNLTDMKSITNKNYVETVYKVGEMVYPDSWDEDRWEECSHGIHFFMTFNEAVNY